MTQNAFRPGTTINIDMHHGEDFSRQSVIVIREFDFKQELSAFVDLNKALDSRYSYEPQDFMTHLVNKGFIIEVKYSSVHIGDYNDPDLYIHNVK